MSFKLGRVWPAINVIALGCLACVQPLGAQTTTVLTGPLSVSGTKSGCSSSDAFSAVGTITITVQPSLSSLAAAGGQATGSMTLSGTRNFCDVDETFILTDPVTGIVSTGGQTTLTITQLAVTGQDGRPGCTFTATGTATDVIGTVPTACFGNEVATGTFEATNQPAAVLSGPFSGTRTKNGTGCATSNAATFSGTVTFTLQPALAHLRSFRYEEFLRRPNA